MICIGHTAEGPKTVSLIGPLDLENGCVTSASLNRHCPKALCELEGCPKPGHPCNLAFAGDKSLEDRGGHAVRAGGLKQ